MRSMTLETTKLAIVGLGYVGLPLATEFGKQRSVVGFDTDSERIRGLRNAHDVTCEVSKEELQAASQLTVTDRIEDIADCNFYIITVPTPITDECQPDLRALVAATSAIGRLLCDGDIVVYESTVYPGCTEERCVPILQAESGLMYNEQFYCGYSPERINPGDKTRRIADVVKVTSGSNEEISIFVDALYRTVVKAGTHRAPSIKVAEAAKVIENVQRDLNIALVNELSSIFHRLEVDTEQVLQAAETKWNFMSYRPGLVGGHCISVDPYYLTYKAKQVGINPEIILGGRKINDGMSGVVVDRLREGLRSRKKNLSGSSVLILGYTFKENCPDTRNTKIFDLIKKLEQENCEVSVFDPFLSSVNLGLQCRFISLPTENRFDAVIVAVAHDEFKQMGGKKIRGLLKNRGLVFDLKFILDADQSDMRL